MSVGGTVTREKVEHALLSEGEQFNRSRVLELERQVQNLLIQDDIHKQEIERLRGELGNMTQLRNLIQQLKRDNANLCADLEQSQHYVQQELSRRDTSSIQRDQLTRHTKQLDQNNVNLRKKLVEADARLAAANDRAGNLRDHLAKTMKRAAELEAIRDQRGSKEEEGGVFGQAMLERLEELEAELVFTRAAAARTTTKYVLREATGAFEPVMLEEVHTIAGRGTKVSGVFGNRKTAELYGRNSKLTMDYKSLSKTHKDMEKDHSMMVEETEMLKKQLRDCTVQLRNARMQTAMKLAMQKSVLSKQKLSSNLYSSRGGIGGGHSTSHSDMRLANEKTRNASLQIASSQYSNSRSTPQLLPVLQNQLSKTRILDVLIPTTR
jgi:chromosome segregation ATPase